MFFPKDMNLANDCLVQVLERVYVPNESGSLDLSQSCVKTFNVDNSAKLCRHGGAQLLN